MPTIHREITVNAPIDKVFSAIDNPEDLPDFAPGVRDVHDIHRTPRRLGDTFRISYAVLGIPFPQQFTVTEYRSPSRVQLRFEGFMSGTMEWRLCADGAFTRVSVDVTYEVPSGSAARSTNLLPLQRINEKNADGMLANLKRKIELL